MANIDNLNFKVIIDDKDFNKKIKELESLAQRFNTNMTTALNLRGGSQALTQQEVVGRRRALQAAVDEARAQERINREKIKTEGLQRRINEQIERGAAGYRTQSRLLRELKGYALGYLSIHGVTQFLSSLVRVTGEFELQKTTLAAMLNDLGAAERIITNIQGLAVKSPFQFKELTTYAKQLSAFSVPAEELYETTKMLADISAGLGVGMDRIVLAYGQVRSAAFLRGQEVRQFTEAGIPILQELADQFEEVEGRAVSAGEVFDKISARLVPFEMVAKVFKNLTSEGGKFFNMQEVQADTLKGKISNLKDAYEIMLNEIGRSASDEIKGAVDSIARMIRNYEETGRTILELVAAYGVYRTALFLTTKLQKTFARNLVVLRKELSLTKRLMAINPYTAIAAGVTGAIGLFYKLGKEMHGQSVIFESLNESQEKFQIELNKEIAALDVLKAKLELADKGTKEYNDAISAIQKDYAPYVEQLREEGAQIDTLTGLYDNLKRKIEEAAHARFVAYARQDIDEAYTQQLSGLMKGTEGYARSNLKDLVEDLNLTQAEEAVLRMYITGVTSWEELSEKYSELAQKITDNRNRVSLGSGDTGPMQAKKYLDMLKSMAGSLTEDYQNAIATIEEFAVVVTRTNNEAAQSTSKFVETVQSTLMKLGAAKDNVGIFSGLWVDDTTNYYDYLERIRKEYKAIQQKIQDVGTTQRSNLPDLEKQKEAIEAISKALGISLSTEGGGGGTKSKAQERLEAQIELVKKLQRAYEQLRPYVDDSTVKGLLSKYFPEAKEEWIDSLDFESVLNSLADQLERYDKEAANSLRGFIRDEKIADEVKALEELDKKYKESADAAKKYFEAIRKWQTSDFGIEGSGIAFDIGKIANQLSTKFNEIDLEAKKIAETFNKIDLKDTKAVEAIKNTFEKEFGEGTWDAFYDEFVSKGEAAIEDFAKKQTDYERKLAQERLNDIAKKYVNESLEGLDMSHWGDKTLGQIDAIRQQLMDLMSKDIELPESTITKLNDLGLSTEELKRKIAELFGLKLENVTTEKFKALSKVINDVAGMAKSLGGELEELGDTLGNDMVSNIGKSLQVFEELTKILTECDSLMQAVAKASSDSADETEEAAKSTEKAAEGMGNIAKSSDWVTMALKLVISVFSKVVDGITESQKALQEAREAAIEYANALKQLEYETMRQSYESIFGTDDYKQAIASFEKAKEYRKSIYEAIRVFREQVSLQNSGAFQAFDSLSEGKTAEEIDALERLLGIGEIIVDARTEWQKFWGTGDDLIQKFNINDFLDEEGMLDGDKLSEWMKANSEHISEYNQNRLNEMLKDYVLYIQAVKDAESYLQDVYDNSADGMADAYIEAFKATGEAALDYADIMDEVATNIAKSLVKSMILDEIVSPEKIKEMSALLFAGDEAGAMEILDEAMQAAQVIAPMIQALLESMQPYFKMEDEDKQSLSDGIKGITEDTANLLASYLNAIRADVSYSKTLWERMDAATQQIATVLAGFSAPTLIDYQKRIEANTYNIQMYTSQILLELQSVITSDGGGGSAVRILS